MTSRRRVPAACLGIAEVVGAGCLSGRARTTATPAATATEACEAQSPPAPADAATEPRTYPDRPSELTTGTVEEFLGRYEAAYQYNDALAATPNEIGRTNELTIRVRSVSVAPADDGYTGTVSGRFRSEFIYRDATTTPETPTETPLPAGHGPFEASYTLTRRTLVRNGVVRACW